MKKKFEQDKNLRPTKNLTAHKNSDKIFNNPIIDPKIDIRGQKSSKCAILKVLEWPKTGSGAKNDQI
jgi:hypothetical protein